LADTTGLKAACALLELPRSSYYRQEKNKSNTAAIGSKPRKAAPPRALTAQECQAILEIVNSERFMDKSPREIYAALLDEGIYLCSWRTIYRLLKDRGEVRERRNQAVAPIYKRPELLAIKPRQLWSWDITKLRGAQRYCYYQLYVIIDVFSRFIVGWMLSEQESGELAEEFIAETCAKEGIGVNELTLHADRGSSMKSKCVAQLLADLGVQKSHSRPHVSNDNPFSEAQFKTLKYRPSYPDRFGCIEDARVWVREFINWYNQEHHHVGLSLLTPAMVHHGVGGKVLADRAQTMDKFYEIHPDRFVKGAPKMGKLPEAVWINPPLKEGEIGQGNPPDLP